MTGTIELSRLNFRDFVRPGDMVAWGQASGEPLSLTETLMAQRAAIGPFSVFTGLCYSDTANPDFTDQVSFVSYHGGGSNRRLSEAGKLEILPVHYSALPELLRHRVEVLLLHLPPADANGRFSLGLSHDYVISLIDNARTVIAEINDQLPWVNGERLVAASDIDMMVKTSRPPLDVPSRPGDEIDRKIAAAVAGLIEDGATIQIGIGALPTAILAALGDHRHLGIHSGSLFDPVVDLMRSGAVDNSRKTIDRGVSIAGSLLGTKELFAFADRNDRIAMRSVSYTHDIAVIGALDKFVALNSAIEVDVTGQINAETVGGKYLGAVGGAVDFLRGARRSRGCLPIVSLQSRAGGKAKIVTHLAGPVSTSRADSGLIVTEYGVADLRGQSLSERTRRMIAIAHPDDRERLEKAAFSALR
ncbi:MAG: acetyl-CoA hydrolase/transferase family protein [Stellaceae bacterium]